MDDPSITGWLVAIRGVHFACCLLTAGMWAFDRLIVTEKSPQWRRLMMAILIVGIPLIFVSGAAWFVLVAGGMSDLPIGSVIHDHPVLQTVWLHTRFGRVWQIHLGFWIAILVTFIFWWTMRRGQWIGMVMGAGLVGSLAWAGHGTTGAFPRWHIVFDTIHLLAACLWPTGLVPFSLSVAVLARANRAIEISRVTHRFSNYSLAAVAILFATGIFNSVCLLGSPSNLLTTYYGRILTIKISLFIIMIGIGAINLLYLKPRVLHESFAVRYLLRNVMIEIVLSMGVIVVVAYLGLSEPPH